MQKKKLGVSLMVVAVLLMSFVACGTAPQAPQEVSLSRSEIRPALIGGWELETRYLAGGQGALEAPKVTGFLISNETHSVSVSPLADQPEASLISVARTQLTDAGQTVQLIYQTTSANSSLDEVRRDFGPQEAAFSSALEAEDEERLRSIADSEVSKALTADAIVRRLPDQPTEVYTADRLIRIADSHVDVYRRLEEEVKPQSGPQETLRGAFEMRWRSTQEGRQDGLFGFLLETPTLSVGLVPFAAKPEAQLVYAAKSSFSGSSQRAGLFYLTCSANAALASRIFTEFPAESFSFSQELTDEESARLKEAGVDVGELSRLNVQRSESSPTHVYAGNQLFIIDKGFVDGYELVRPN